MSCSGSVRSAVGNCGCPPPIVISAVGCEFVGLPGVPVSIYSDAALTTLVDSGDTDDDGFWSPSVSSSGDYWVVAGGAAPYASTVLHIDVSGPGGGWTVFVEPDADHVCIAGCTVPVARVQPFVDSVLGSSSATWNESLKAFVGVLYVDFPGAVGCPDVDSVPVTYRLTYIRSYGAVYTALGVYHPLQLVGSGLRPCPSTTQDSRVTPRGFASSAYSASCDVFCDVRAVANVSGAWPWTGVDSPVVRFGSGSCPDPPAECSIDVAVCATDTCDGDSPLGGVHVDVLDADDVVVGECDAGSLFTAGPAYADSCVDGGGGGASWASASNAKASDGSYATATLSSGATNPLVWTDFGFSIPSGATILGLKAEIYGSSSNEFAGDSTFYWRLSGADRGTDHGAGMPFSDFDSALVFGGPTDLGGAAWSPAQINDSTFGLKFGCSAGRSSTFRVDYARVTVYASDGPDVGCCTVTLSASGSYTAVVSKTGYPTTSKEFTVACDGGPYTIEVPVPPVCAEGLPPGLPARAVSAMKAAARFAASGGRTASPETLDARLAVCRTCDWYTGSSCRLCGCNAALKLRMASEACPAGKWPAETGGG